MALRVGRCARKLRLHKSERYEVEYEVEVSYEGTIGFRRYYDDCPKNPNHESFISENEFIRQGPSCLPNGYTDQLVFKFIKSQATLTVKLIVGCVSKGRPAGYVLADWKWMRNISFPGTGMVVKVKRQNVKDGQLCPCSECISSSTVCNSQCKELFTLEVRTARHVVYDQMEADATTLHLSYFTEEKETEVTLSPCHIIRSFIDSDQSALSFTTHDTHLCERIIHDLEDISFISRDVAKQFNKNKDNIFLPIVSYPHGLDKQISFGFIKKVTGKREVQYNTPTCPGSSGAGIYNPIWLALGRMLYYHHEGYNRTNGNNLSGKTSSVFDWFLSSSASSRLSPQDEDSLEKRRLMLKDRGEDSLETRRLMLKDRGEDSLETRRLMLKDRVKDLLETRRPDRVLALTKARWLKDEAQMEALRLEIDTSDDNEADEDEAVK